MVNLKINSCKSAFFLSAKISTAKFAKWFKTNCAVPFKKFANRKYPFGPAEN